jgi:multiple sugar transport system substrate-binding protein
MLIQDRRLGLSRRSVIGTGASGVAAALLAACGAGAQQPAAQKKGPVTIEVLTRSGVSAPDGHSQFFDKRAKAIFTPETNITVNFVDAAPDVGQKLTVLATAGSLPDGSWFGVVADGYAGREQAGQGIFKPLDDIIKKDSKFDLKPYFKSMLDALTVNGKLYALPIHAHYGTNVLYYNKTMLDGAGLKIDDTGQTGTFDDLISMAQKLTKKEQDTWGFWPGMGLPEFGAFWVRMFGGELFSEDGKKCLIDSPESRAGIEAIYNCQTKFQVINDLYRTVEGAPLNQGGSRGLFSLGKLAMHHTTPGLVASYRLPNQQELKFELGVAVFPKGPKARGTQASGSGMGLVGTKNTDATWEWLKFVSNKDNGIEQVFGGAGSPGGRTDSWNDPKLLKERDPIYQNIIKAYPQGAGSLRLAANNRYSPAVNAVNTELTNYFKGQVSLQDATSKAAAASNIELSR